MPQTTFYIALTGVAFMSLALMSIAARAQAPAPATSPEITYNNHCRTCHSIKPDDNRLGPTLHGVVGRKAGAVDGYSYSPGFKTSKLVWDEKTLDRFIANPNAVFPGSNMATFAGLSDEGDRAAIVEYLKTLK